MKYRKAREIIDQASETLSGYEAIIDYTKLYKIIRRCNAELGARINPEKQDMIHIKAFKSYLPENFLSLNFAFLCHEKIVKAQVPHGFQVEYKTLCKDTTKSCSPCVSDCDGTFAIYQLLDDNWTQFKQIEVAKVTPKSFNRCAQQCPNVFSLSHQEFEIREDGSVVTNFETGYMYLNYTAIMEDTDEDLLVLDHPTLETYYENAVIKEILKTTMYNKQGDVVGIYQDSLRELSRARTAAFNLVNTPGYDEVHELMQSQRTRMYNKFFAPILGYCK